MAWVRLDDGFYDNPKILAAGLAGAGLYAKALAYAGRKLTDGFISAAVVSLLADNVDDLWTDLVPGLVNLRLWEAIDGGYLIHDYLRFNPSRVEIEARREAWKRAGRRGGQLSGVTRKRSKREAKGEAKGEASCSVLLRGSRSKGDLYMGSSGSGSLFSVEGESRGGDPAAAGFATFWAAYPRKEAKIAAQRAWQALRPDAALQATIAAALAWQTTTPQWCAGIVPHAATYLHGRRWEDRRPTTSLAGTSPRTAGNLAAIKAGLELVTHDRR